MEWHIQKKCISAIACLLAMGAAAQAKTIRVGSEGADGHQSLRSAVDAAQSGDVIVVAEGRYTGSANRDIEILSKAITIRSLDPNDPAVAARTVIDCQGSEAAGHRAFDIRPEGGARLVLEGLTITNGFSPISGGAVLCEGAEFRAINCVFSDNRVEWWGGAVNCRDSQARLEGCTFSNNASKGSHGGAVFCATSVLELEACTFEANRSAIESHDSSLTLRRCVFQRNTGKDGSAIHSRMDANPQKSTNLNLSRCTFVANAAEGSGGALYSYEVNSTLDGCTFTANTAGKDGGAILSYRASPVLTDCILAGNVAAGLGGGILSQLESTPQIVNCTLVANRADRGGAVAGKGAADSLISHCILWNNTADQGPNLYLARYDWDGLYPATAKVEFSDVAGGQASLYTELDCRLTWASGNLSAEPLFAGPARNDYRLSPDSPCVDAGDPCYAPPRGSTDLDNAPRQSGPAVDMGAYEFRGLGPVYRFWSPVNGRHFYTIQGTERDALIRDFPHFWTLEDVAYYAFSEPVLESLLPVYRFWSARMETHFWTISEQERLALMRDSPDVWTFEGIAFYAYPQNDRPLGAVPVYQFRSRQFGDHFYTANETEKDFLIESYGNAWEFEGVAWYAHGGPHPPDKAAYAFAGGPEEARCTLTLAAVVEGQEARISAPDIVLSPAASQMQMTIDFRGLSLTLDKLSVQTKQIEHAVEISLPGTNVVIPLVLSVEASFTLPTPRGPFAVDPATGMFADFVREHQTITGDDSLFTYRGSVSLAGKTIDFERTMQASRLELESFGAFESLELLPGGLHAGMPRTFQWRREQTGDLLAEGSAAGRRVQIYVIRSYVGTEGLWRAKLIEGDGQFPTASRYR